MLNIYTFWLRKYKQGFISLFLLSAIVAIVSAQPVAGGFLVHTKEGKIKKIKKVNVIYLYRQNDRATTIAMEREGKLETFKVSESVKVINQWLGFPAIDYGFAANPRSFTALSLENGRLIPLYINYTTSYHKEIENYLKKYPLELGKRNARLILQNFKGEIVAAPLVSKREVPNIKNIISQSNSEYERFLSASAGQFIKEMEMQGLKETLRQTLIQSYKGSPSNNFKSKDKPPTLHELTKQLLREGGVIKYGGLAVPPSDFSNFALIDFSKGEKTPNGHFKVLSEQMTRLAMKNGKNFRAK